MDPGEAPPMLLLLVSCSVAAPPDLPAVRPDPPPARPSRPGPDLASGYRSGTAAWLDRGVGEADFHTGATLFDQEWLYGTYSAAGGITLSSALNSGGTTLPAATKLPTETVLTAAATSAAL